MKLTRISITNLLGIEALETTIHPEGAIATGGNAAGKTSFIKAVRAALEAAGVDSSAIRIGADKSEIILDTDAAVKIRRGITSSGSSLTVTNKDGDKWARPQTRLTELVGATLDPLAFYLASPNERRKQILAAMPVTVTTEDLKRWTGADYDVTEGRHGLEVIASVRKDYYDERTEANRTVKAAEAAHKAADEEFGRLVTPDLAGVEVPSAGEEDKPVLEAEQRKRELEQRQRVAEEQAEQAKGTRQRIATLRDQASTKERNARPAVPAEDMRRADVEQRDACDEVSRLKDELAQAELRKRRADERLADLSTQNESHLEWMAAAGKLRAQADDLETTLAETSIEAPAPADLEAAEAGIVEARRHAELVGRARAAHNAAVEAASLGDELAKAKKHAADLDAIVQRLTTEAPAEVAKRSQAISGLSFGDKGITLDGKAIDNLSGAEQLRFAVDLAKRASKAKILVVDGLERLDKTRLREFVSYATADGFQLLATLVTDGPLHIVEPSRITLVGPDQATEVRS